FDAARDVQILQITEPPVDDTQAVLRRRAAEVAALDERAAQARSGGLEMQHRAVNAAADDDDVVLDTRDLEHVGGTLAVRDRAHDYRCALARCARLFSLRAS